MNIFHQIVSKMKPQSAQGVVKSHATASGRLFIKSSEFFALPKVQQMIRNSMNSDIYKQIEARKQARAQEG